MNMQQRYLETLMICPNTGRQVSGKQFTFHPTSVGKAVWWRCSACQRWHILEIKAGNCSDYPQLGLSESKSSRIPIQSTP